MPELACMSDMIFNFFSSAEFFCFAQPKTSSLRSCADSGRHHLGLFGSILNVPSLLNQKNINHKKNTLNSKQDFFFFLSHDNMWINQTTARGELQQALSYGLKGGRDESGIYMSVSLVEKLFNAIWLNYQSKPAADVTFSVSGMPINLNKTPLWRITVYEYEITPTYFLSLQGCDMDLLLQWVRASCLSGPDQKTWK